MRLRKIQFRWSKDGLWWVDDSSGVRHHQVVGIIYADSKAYTETAVINILFLKLRVDIVLDRKPKGDTK